MVGRAANVLKESLDSQRVFGRFGYFFSGRKPNARIVSKGLRVFDSFRNSLSNQWREKLRVGPVVAWFARRIDDPILRLRFLRAVMLPGPERSSAEVLHILVSGLVSGFVALLHGRTLQQITGNPRPTAPFATTPALTKRRSKVKSQKSKGKS